MPENLTRGEIQDLLTKFSKSNPRYREALLKDPKLVLEGQMGEKIPDGITVKAVEETPTSIYVVVPYVPKPGAELSNHELEAVAGGGSKGGVSSSIRGAVGGPVHGNSSHDDGEKYRCNTSQFLTLT